MRGEAGEVIIAVFAILWVVCVTSLIAVATYWLIWG